MSLLVKKKTPVCEGVFVAKFGGVGCVSNFYYTLRDLHIGPWVNLSPFTLVFEPLFTVTVIFCFLNFVFNNNFIELNIEVFYCILDYICLALFFIHNYREII